MWQAIQSVLTSPNSWFTLLVLIALVILMIISAKRGLFAINTKAVKVGNDKNEREIIRQQADWAYNHLEGKLKERNVTDDNFYRAEVIMEKIYDEVVRWITLNHLSTNSAFISIKQDKIVSLVAKYMTKEELENHDFIDWLIDDTEIVIKQLVQIREVYQKQ